MDKRNNEKIWRKRKKMTHKNRKIKIQWYIYDIIQDRRVLYIYIMTEKLYIGCPILTFTPKYLEMYKRYRKMFQTKVVGFEGGHKRGYHWFNLG